MQIFVSQPCIHNYNQHSFRVRPKAPTSVGVFSPEFQFSRRNAEVLEPQKCVDGLEQAFVAVYMYSCTFIALFDTQISQF